MGTPLDPTSRIESLDQDVLEERLRDAARGTGRPGLVDDLEVRHLVRVITECSLLLSDVYSDERIARIMHPERGFLSRLVDQLISQQRRGEGEVLYRVRRLPDDVRMIGDKALFDMGISGRRSVRGYDLEELGGRAYQMAGEVLEALAEDRRLKRFFDQNRLLTLPLEDEVIFLHQCAERFKDYAEILQRCHVRPAQPDLTVGDPSFALLTPPTLLPGAASVLTDEAEPAADDPYVSAARGVGEVEVGLSREQQISSYERILLFSALDLGRLRSALDATVIDQQPAVETLCDEFSLFAAGTRDPRKPPAYFLCGPTGVGKNHLVESLCRTMEGIWKLEIPMLTIEGPNYTYPSDINELRGATRGFIRSDEEGILTSFHEKSSRSPLSIILVDEVEKAHPQLLTFFLSILDRGTTTDNRGNVLNFANCMLFFTSNLGYSDAQQRSAPVGFLDELARQDSTDTDIRRDLRKQLKPEFVNRVRLVHFNRLTQASAERILTLELEKIARRYRELHDLELELDPSATAELIQRGFSPIFGARHLAKTLDSVCNVEVAKRIRIDDGGAGGDRDELISWLREMRAGDRPFAEDEVRRKVLESAGARLDYRRLRVVFRDGAFHYEPVEEAVQVTSGRSLIEHVCGLLERTYDLEPLEQALGSFIIGDRGYRELYDEGQIVRYVDSADGQGARTLVRSTPHALRLAIYLPDAMVQQLEHYSPLRGLSAANLQPFATLVEELDHLLTIVERERRGRGISLFELELHANVSKFLVLSRFAAGNSRKLDEVRRRWLLHQLFDGVDYTDQDPAVCLRYRDAARWAIRFLNGMQQLKPARRLITLRRFHHMPAADKLRLIDRYAA